MLGDSVVRTSEVMLGDNVVRTSKVMLGDNVVRTSEVKWDKRVAMPNSGVVRMGKAKWMSEVF